MSPLPVIENLDVLLNRGPRLSARDMPPMMDKFILKRAPETFHGRVVIAVPTARQQCAHAKLRYQSVVGMSTILGAADRAWLCVQHEPQR